MAQEQLINDFMEYIKVKKKKDFYDKPSNLYVSTKVCCCKLNCKIDNSAVIQHIKRVILKDIVDETHNEDLTGINSNANIVGIKYTGEDEEKNKCEFIYSKLGSSKIKSKKKLFNNSTTIIVRLENKETPVNIKFFVNGSVSMSGCKKDDDGLKAMRILIKELQNSPSVFLNNIENLEKVNIIDYDISCINANYNIGFSIDREKLIEILEDKYKLKVKFKPKRYPGVLISYMINTECENEAICPCPRTCRGKGKKATGSGMGCCKKITLSVFQSGNIIITGAKNIEQTIKAYKYINGIIHQYFNTITKFSIEDCYDDFIEFTENYSN